MLFELIAVVVAGFAGAGLAMLLRKLSGGRTPRWLTPVAAGGAMMAVAIANEYSWFPRQSQGLPEGLEIVMTVDDPAIYRPWTYVVPFVSRFLAVDMATIKRNDAAPDLALADVWAFARWQPPQQISAAVDCAGNRLAQLTGEASFGEDGQIDGLTWLGVGPDDPVISAVCRG